MARRRRHPGGRGGAARQRRRDRWRTVGTVVTDETGAATTTSAPARRRPPARCDSARLGGGAHSQWKRIDNGPPLVRCGWGRGPRTASAPAPGPGGRGRSRHHADPGRGVALDGGAELAPGCPVGRDGLRLVRVNYVDFTGYRRRGELVVAAGAVAQFVGALTELHDRGIPIRSMYRVDRFGWSGLLTGADDVASMAAGNTSAFNCRHVVGRPGVRSPHSYGRAVDINPWENPYRVGGRWLPNAWWPGHSHPRVAWRSRSHVVVWILRRYGFSWTYGVSDSQHFDARSASGRVVAGARRSATDPRRGECMRRPSMLTRRLTT